MKTITTYVLKKNGAEIEVHADKATAMKSRDMKVNAHPCAHQDGGNGKGYEVFRRTETKVWQ